MNFLRKLTVAVAIVLPVSLGTAPLAAHAACWPWGNCEQSDGKVWTPSGYKNWFYCDNPITPNIREICYW